jgi:hypothetical protein
MRLVGATRAGGERGGVIVHRTTPCRRRIRVVVVDRAQAGTSQKWLNSPIKIMNGMGTPRTKSKMERIGNLLD